MGCASLSQFPSVLSLSHPVLHLIRQTHHGDHKEVGALGPFALTVNQYGKSSHPTVSSVPAIQHHHNYCRY